MSGITGLADGFIVKIVTKNMLKDYKGGKNEPKERTEANSLHGLNNRDCFERTKYNWS